MHRVVVALTAAVLITGCAASGSTATSSSTSISGSTSTSSAGGSSAPSVDLARTQPCDLVAQSDLEHAAGVALPAHTEQTKHETSDDLAGIYSGPAFDLDVDVCIYTDGQITADGSDTTGSRAIGVGIATVHTGTPALDFLLGHGWSDESREFGKPAGYAPGRGVALVADATHIVVTLSATRGDNGALSTDESSSVALMRLVAARLS